MDNKKALIIFIKNAVEGKVKTRLAASIGNNAALKVYHKLLDITKSASSLVKANRYLFYSAAIKVNDDWSKLLFKKHLQKGENLGDKMKNAFQFCFDEEHKKVIIIGSDCPKISNEIIENAFEKLNNFDFVIGPANDGGYYLFGMKKQHNFVFENKKWSTNTLLAATIKEIENHHLKYFLLQELIDIDNIDDLKNFDSILD